MSGCHHGILDVIGWIRNDDDVLMFSINSEQLPHLTRIIISVGRVFVGRRRICGIICGIIIVVGCWVLSSIILYDLSYRMSAINILIDGGRSGIISFMYSRVL